MTSLLDDDSSFQRSSRLTSLTISSAASVQMAWLRPCERTSAGSGDDDGRRWPPLLLLPPSVSAPSKWWAAEDECRSYSRLALLMKRE